jgi:hypothetical protein
LPFSASCTRRCAPGLASSSYECRLSISTTRPTIFDLPLFIFDRIVFENPFEYPERYPSCEFDTPELLLFRSNVRNAGRLATITATAASIIDHKESRIGPSATVVGFVCDSAVAFVTLKRRMKAKTTTMIPRENRQESASFCFRDILNVMRRRNGSNMTRQISKEEETDAGMGSNTKEVRKYVYTGRKFYACIRTLQITRIRTASCNKGQFRCKLEIVIAYLHSSTSAGGHKSRSLTASMPGM